MYYIHDLYTGTWKTFESKEAVAFWWGSKRIADDNLNVTGKDNYADKEHCGYEFDKDGLLYPLFLRTEPRPRRYQVFDDAFRSIDIRLWPESVWNASPRPRPFHSSAFIPGSKRHHRSITGPAMAHSTSRQDADRVDYEELYQSGCPLPERDRSAVRRKVLISDADSKDHIDRSWTGFRSWSCSKSWKDQYKSRKQWGKHRHITRIPQEIAENREDLAARLMAELIPEAGGTGIEDDSREEN